MPLSALTMLLFFMIVGCGQNKPPVAIETAVESEMDKPGLYQVFGVTDKLLSGSSPDGEISFKSLKNLGVKTIISVDGAKPNVDMARKFGMRYVHLPVGYDGIPCEHSWRLAKAVRDFPGMVYIHCHHGKHRGPAAAATIRLCLDSTFSIDDALAMMKQAGTDMRYQGLYDSVKHIERPTTQQLDRLIAEFPEVAEVSPLARAMVEIDKHIDELLRHQSTEWKPTKENFAHSALMIAEHYRESARLNNQGPELKRLLRNGEQTANNLEHELRLFVKADKNKLNELMKQMKANCVECHASHRDAAKRKTGVLEPED